MFTLAKAVIDITAPLTQFNASMAQINRSMAGMRTSMAIPAFGIAAGAGMGAIALGVAKAVSASSDLTEAISKTKEIAGDSYATAARGAEELASKHGLVKAQVLDTTANIIQMARGMGMASGASAEFGVHFAKLAADLQSFNNLPSYETAVIKLQAALAGETEALGRLGTNVREAAVLEYARARGIARTTEELTEQQKVMIRANIITQSLSAVSGDLARTQGDYANQMRRFSGTLTNTFASLGQAMQPAFDAIASALNGAADAFSGWVETNRAAIRAFAVNLVEMGGQFLSTMRTVVSAVSEAGTAFNQWVANSEAFKMAIGGLNSAYVTMRNVASETMTAIGVVWRNWTQIAAEAVIRGKQAVFNLIDGFEWLGKTMSELRRWIVGNWKEAIVDAVTAIGYSVMNLVKNLTNLGSAIGTFAGDPTRGFEFHWTPLLDGFKATIKELPKIARPVFTDLQHEIDDLRKQVGANEMAAAGDAIAGAGGPAGRKAAANAVRAAKMFDIPSGRGSMAKSEFIGLAEFAKKIQVGTLGKDKAADQHLSVARQSLGVLGRIDEAVRRPQVAVAVGPA